MWESLLRSVAGLGVVLLSASGAAAQTDSVAGPSSAADTTHVDTLTAAPLLYEGYTLSLTERFTDRRLGMVYRFTKSTDPYVDVFVFPYPDAAITPGTDKSTDAVNAAASEFLASLPIMRQRGMVDDYRVAFSKRDSIQTHSGWVRGNFTTVAMKRHGAVFVSVFYIYGFPNELVKVRLDLPLAVWQRSEAPLWARRLVAHMYDQPERRDDLGSARMLPAKIGLYELYLTSTAHDSSVVVYRYRAPSGPDIRVSLRPASMPTGSQPGGTVGDSTGPARAEAVVNEYTTRLEQGKIDGFSGYTSVVSHPDTAIVAGTPTIGYIARGQFSCGPSVCLHSDYAYVVGGHLVTVRAEAPKEAGLSEDIGPFTHTLVAALAESQ